MSQTPNRTIVLHLLVNYQRKAADRRDYSQPSLNPREV